MSEFNIIGRFSATVVLALGKLGLSIKAETAIFLSETTLEHIQERHFEDFQAYSVFVGRILSEPDYIGVNPDNSICFVKEIESSLVCVPVRVSKDGLYFVRTLHRVHKRNIERYVAKNRYCHLT